VISGRVLRALARADAAAGRLVSSVEASVVAAENRLAMAMNQVVVIEAKSHAMAPPCDGDAVRWFEVRTPDGRVIRHRAVSLEANGVWPWLSSSKSPLLGQFPRPQQSGLRGALHSDLL
jgi:hypothetical protein